MIGIEITCSVCSIWLFQNAVLFVGKVFGFAILFGEASGTEIAPMQKMFECKEFNIAKYDALNI